MSIPLAEAPNPADLPLVDAIIEALKEVGHPYPEFWIACALDGRYHRLHPHAWDKNIDFDRQRFLVNRQWELVLGGFDPAKAFPPEVAGEYKQEQMRARYCLLPQGKQDVWLKSFKEGVIPVLLKYSLPLIPKVEAPQAPAAAEA